MSSQVLNISEDSDSINSLGNSCALHLLWLKTSVFHFVSTVSFSLKCHQWEQSDCISFTALCQIFLNIPLSLLQDEQGPHSSYVRYSSPLITFVALFWTCSRISMSLLCWGAHDLTQYSRCGPPISHREERSPPLTLSVVSRSLKTDLLNLKTFLILDFKNIDFNQTQSDFCSY